MDTPRGGNYVIPLSKVGFILSTCPLTAVIARTGQGSTNRHAKDLHEWFGTLAFRLEPHATAQAKKRKKEKKSKGRKPMAWKPKVVDFRVLLGTLAPASPTLNGELHASAQSLDLLATSTQHAPPA
jgi:hypothetical protein